EVLNGAEEAQSVLKEGDHDAEGEAAALDAKSAKGEDRRERDHGQELDHGVEPAVSEDGVLIGVHVVAVDDVEFALAAALAIEELEDDDPGDVLLQVRVDPGDGDADAAVALRDAAAEDEGRADYEGHGREHDGGEERGEPEHDGDDEG